ncbi:MAG TPA: hypothetical protein VF768_05665, partial [Holophagaceae bacterium]
MRRALPFLLAMLPLCAQDAALGARVQVVVPMGDLRDLTNGQTGLGAGVFVEIPVGNEVRLRPTLGAQYFPKKTSGSLGGADVTVSSADLLLDALWFPGGSA